MKQGPIFIGGLSHSGKTPLRLMLSAHPDLALTRRTAMWPRYYNRYGDLSQPQCFEACLQAMLQSRTIRVLHPDPERIRREFATGEATYGRLFALFHQHYAEQLGKPRWGDQTGFIERYAAAIFKAYPSARIIHMIRDPRDRYASLKSATVPSPKVGYTTAEWLSSVDLARYNCRRYDGRYLLIHYETLLSAPEQTVRQVCAFLDEPFTSDLLTLEKAIRFGEEDSDVTPPNPETVSLRLSTPTLAFIQRYAGSHMITLGYPLQSTSLSLSQRCRFTLFDHPLNLLQMGTYKARLALQTP